MAPPSVSKCLSVVVIIALWFPCSAARSKRFNQAEQASQTRGGNCCCKEEACTGRRSGNNPLFEYQYNGKSICCKARGNGFSNFGGMSKCPWYGYSKAAEDALPDISDPCGCHHWNVWTEKPKFSDVNQGALGSCYLLASLASLAHVQPQMIEKMFSDGNAWKGSKDKPVFRTEWQINGKAISVAVDSMVPVSKETGEPTFATYNVDRSFGRPVWPMILEKAFAKIYGNYQNIEAGWAHEVIYAITGAPVFRLMRPDDNREAAWQALKTNMDKKYVLWANNDKGVHGLTSGHAYAVLAYREEAPTGRYLHVYNPWSSNGYNGVLKEMKEDDASFWMTDEEFWENFDHVQVAEIRPGYREISLQLGHRVKSAEASVSFTMNSDRPFIVAVSTHNKRFFKGTQCEGKANDHSMWLDDNDQVEWNQGSDTLFKRFPGKQGHYKIYAKVEYPEKNWDTRVRVYAHEQDLVGGEAPILVEQQTVADPELDDCHATAGNYESLNEWREIIEDGNDAWFPPSMQSIAYKGANGKTECGDTAQGIHEECTKFNNWGSFVDAVC